MKATRHSRPIYTFNVELTGEEVSKLRVSLQGLGIWFPVVDELVEALTKAVFQTEDDK